MQQHKFVDQTSSKILWAAQFLCSWEMVLDRTSHGEGQILCNNQKKRDTLSCEARRIWITLTKWIVAANTIDA